MKIQRKWKFVFIVIFAIALMLLARSCGSSTELSKAESGARGVFAPFHAVGDFFGNFFDFSTKNQLQKDLDKANKDLAKYKTKESLSEDVATENKRLRKLLEIKESYAKDWDMCVASVSVHEIDNWYERITVDKGSADGVKENMAVVNEDGLVGRTVNVTSHTCDVLLIIDAQGSLGGMTQESRIPGVLTGIGGGKGLLNMTNLPFNAEIQLNDIVVTSGQGGIFPAGLLVGTVVKVSNSLDGLSKTAIIEPFCDFNSITEVLILIPGSEKKTATTTDKTNSSTSDSTSDTNTKNTGSDSETNNSNSSTNSDSSSDSGGGTTE